MAPLTEPEQRAAFLLRLRAAGVRNLQVLRAMEAVPRAAFFPEVDPAIVLRDIVLPLPGGQGAERPSIIALGLEALGLRPGEPLLEVGTGSGYATALIVRLGALVTSVERRRSLVEAAGTRLSALGLKPEALHWDDGLGLRPAAGSIARAWLHLALPAPPPALLDALGEEGRLLYTPLGRPRRLVLVRRTQEGTVESDVAPSTVLPGGSGKAS